MTDCYACQLSSAALQLVGGRIAETGHWLIEHCQGPLGVGTLIVKPRRHVLHVHALDEAEAHEMGLLLREASRVVEVLTGADQVYVCLWSHAGWEPVHIHYVVQPAFAHMREHFSGGGPTLQSEMFRAGEPLPEAEVEAFCEQARAIFQTDEV